MADCIISGRQGPKGDTGPQGAQGPGGPSNFAFFFTTLTQLSAGTYNYSIPSFSYPRYMLVDRAMSSVNGFHATEYKSGASLNVHLQLSVQYYSGTMFSLVRHSSSGSSDNVAVIFIR